MDNHERQWHCVLVFARCYILRPEIVLSHTIYANSVPVDALLFVKNLSYIAYGSLIQAPAALEHWYVFTLKRGSP